MAENLGKNAGAEGDKNASEVRASSQPDQEAPASSQQLVADPLQVFDFTEAEETVVNSLLEHGAQSVSKLGRTADLPRTTVFSVLQRLKERGLVRRKSKGYASVWERVSPTAIKGNLAQSLEYLDRELTAGQLEEELGVTVGETPDFFTVQGVDSILQTYQWLALNHFNQQVFVIQPQAALDAMLTCLSGEKLAQLSDIFITSRVQLEIVLPEHIQEHYRTVLSEHPEFSKGLKGRGNTAHLLSDTFLSFRTELFIGGNTAFFTDWSKETLMLIKHPDMITLLQQLFSLLCEHGKTVEHHTLLPAAIAEG